MDPATNAAGKRPILTSGAPLVARNWFGRTRAGQADEYLRQNYENGVLEVEKKPGRLGMQRFRRITDDVAEFTTISYWSSMEAMERADGEGLSPTHPERDPDYLLELPDTVEVSELHANDWRPDPQARPGPLLRKLFRAARARLQTPSEKADG